jgi:2-haloacid dehalogenase
MIGTTFSLDRLSRELAERGASAESLPLLFAQTLRDYFASSYAGSYVTLRDVLRSSLQRLFTSRDMPIGDEETDAVLATLTELDPSPGAAEALRLLDEAGVKVIALTNGGTSLMEALLGRAGLTDLVERIVSCDDLGISKPHPAVYEAAREVSDGELWMVACPAWGRLGGGHAGLRTAWISAFETEYPSIFPAPDLIAPDLKTAARAIIDHTD